MNAPRDDAGVEAYQPDVVIYHANCADGFGAAWACWMRWRDACGYVPGSYGQSPPDVAGKHVLIVDFSYKRDVLREMGRQAASVIVLDHHKTAEVDLADWSVDDVAGDFWAGDDPLRSVRAMDEHVGQPIAALFDMDKSGARLAWEFCHEADAPDLVTLIEDRDLWRFRDERTKPFSLWLRARPFDFAEWEMIAQELADAGDSHRIMTEAAAMQMFSDRIVTDIASRARPLEIAGFTVPTVDCPPNFASEVCHALLVKNPDAPFAAAYSDNPNGMRGWSLRSQDHRQDVSEVAKSFGGGGHRNAAGFAVPLGEFKARLSTTTAWEGEAEAARIERQLLAFVADDDDATTVPALQYVMNRSDRIAAALAHPTGDAGQRGRVKALEEALTAEDEYWAASRALASALPRLRDQAHAVLVAAERRKDAARRALASTDQPARGMGA